MEFSVLGPVAATAGSDAADLGGPRQRRLLAALVLHAGQVVPTDRLLEIVFDGEPPDAATTTIRSYIARLRRALAAVDDGAGTRIETGDGGYRLRVDDAVIDAQRFENAIDDAQTLIDDREPARACDALRSGLATWRGDPYGEFGFEEWVQPEVARLTELRLRALEDLNDAMLEAGRADDVAPTAAAQVGEHPLRERMRGQHMLALFRVGRQVEALRSFDAFESELIDSGLEPSDDLRRLARSIAAHDPALRLDRPAGTAVRGYRVGEMVGSGAHGVVFRAVQPGLDRDVAIKTMRPELADDVEFIRRFDAEAQLVASLEHPHIVPIYDYWREPGGAYIVMRLYDDSLDHLLEGGPMETERVAAVVRSIGGALAEAHRRGVVHGDVKPSNVLVDDSGAYLADFGVAALAGTVTLDEELRSPVSGHESPELLAGEPPTAASDQFALAILATRLLTGQLPFGLRGAMTPKDSIPSIHRERRSIPAAVDDVIRRGAAWDPGDRFTDIATFTDELGAALDGRRVLGRPLGPASNPYRGLRAFTEADRDVFFGRSAVVDELVAMLDRPGAQGRFLMTVGASGGGKSSLVRAGVVPALRHGALAGSDDWLVATLVPGDDPHRSLEAALRTIGTASTDRSGDGPTGDIEALINATVAPEHELVVVIDQFEELFTRVNDERARRDFLDGLVHVVSAPASRTRIIATMRADFLDRPLQYAAFGQILKHGAVAVAGLAPAELEQVVTKPAAQVGVDVEPALTTQLIADVLDRPAALPLLQFALTGLFERRTGPVLRLADYQAAGGVAGSVADAAESVIEPLSEADQALAQRLFLRLVTVDDEGVITRRRARRTDMVSFGGDPGSVDGLLEKFGQARLLAFDRDVDTREPTVEIAHEAMIEHWPRFARWIDAAGERLGTQARVRASAATWLAHGRDEADLVRGLRLEEALTLLDDEPDAFDDDERALLDASRGARDGAVAAEAALAERERRSNRRLRGLLAGVGVLLVLALVAGAIAFVQRQRADEEADAASVASAEAQQQAAAAEAAAAAADVATLISRSAALGADDQSELAMLVALEAHRRSPERATEQAVLNALGTSRLPNRLATFPSIRNPGCAPPSFVQSDGLFEYAVSDGRLLRLDLTTGEVSDHGEGPGPCGVWLADPSTDRVFVGSEDAMSGWLGSLDEPYEIELELPAPSFLVGHDGGVLSVAQNSDPTDLAVAVLYHGATGEQIGGALGDPTETGSLTVDPSGAFVFHSWRAIDEPVPGRVLIADAATGDELFLLETPSVALDSVFDPVELEVVMGMRDGSIATIDLVTGEIVAVVQSSESSEVWGVDLQSDGIVVVTRPGLIELVDRRSGPIGVTASVPDVGRAWVRPDGATVIFRFEGEAGFDVVELQGSALAARSWPVSANKRVSFNAGRAAVWDVDLRTGEAVDLATGRRTPIDLRNLDGSFFAADNVYTEADGVWAIGARGVLARFVGDELVREIDFTGRLFTGTRFEDLLAVAEADDSGDTLAHLIDLGPDAEDAGILLTVDAPRAASVHPSLDGGLHVIDNDGIVRTFDPGGELVSEIESGAQSNLINAIDPTTGLLALEDGLGGVVVVDTDSEEVRRIPGEFAVVNLGFDGLGLLVIIEERGTVRAWDLERDELAGTLWSGGFNRQASPAWFDPVAGTMWMFVADRIVEIPLDPERWIERACEVVGRELTADEWRRYVPDGLEQQTAC